MDISDMSSQTQDSPVRRFRVWDGIAALALAGLAVGVWMSVRPPALDAGALRVEPAHVDLGQLRQLQTADARFTLTNTGNDPLTISKVKTSCGCVAPDWKDKSIAPGGSEVLTLAFQAGSASGVKKHEAQLLLSDPDGGLDRRVAVTLAADVIPDYEIEPVAFDFGGVKAGGPVSAALELRRVGQPTPLKIERFKTSHAALTLVEKPGQAGDRLSYDIVLDPARYSAEVFAGEVVLFTNSKPMGRKALPVKARLVRDFRVAPDSVLFCLTDDASGDMTRQLHIAASKPLRADEIAVECAPCEVQAAVSAAADRSGGLAISLTLDASRVQASFEKELTIRAGDLGNVVVPIRCLDLRNQKKELEE